MAPDGDQPRSRADEAYLTLRERIVNCRLAPGQRVTERQLAAELDLGLTPIRQALVRLDSEGLVRTLPRRGYQVTPLTIQSVNELFQIWRILGPAIAELTVKTASVDEREQVQRMYAEKIGRARAENDHSALVELADSMWVRLAEATGNRRLAEMYTRLSGELCRVFRLLFQDSAALDALFGAHGDLFFSFLNADPEESRANAERFITVAHRHALGILMEWPSVAQAEVVFPVA
ncbi:GntR family transcriptional regulator [Actinomadura sp. NBRC 104425]|uniref:GntR family transcriptional regulator n=1 Tax=Actinomadura sp. NBRC 104425 TaxID=3032204 RepID=UPI002552FAAA|nr:GntR family transcriptional regulator [Actinomadura sp. NBRC 104425]